MSVVSVILPCYNVAPTIDETLDSLARQTLSDFEVIAVDDGSDDPTRERLAAWAARDSRFRVFSQPHAGVIAAANAALERCRAPFVARMDADDRAHPQRLEKQAAYLEAHPETAVVASWVKAFPDDQVREGYRIYIQWLNSLVTDADIRREIFVESPLANPSAMLHREWFERMGGYHDYGWPEDYDLWLRMYLAGAKFAKIPEILLEWRDHPQRITRTDGRYSVENFLRAKAHYLARGPLSGRDAIIVWGAGMMGRRLGKQLQRQNLPLALFVDVDPKKIGRTRRGKPIIAPAELPIRWKQYQNPALLAAVGARGARDIIRTHLTRLGLVEGRDWWAAA